MSESAQPTFVIEKVYLKDLSAEVPNGPEVFLERDPPTVEVNLNSAGRQVQDGVYEVVLTVTITARIKEKTVFLVEAAQAGVFQIRNVRNRIWGRCLALLARIPISVCS
jgi:preprotein translocase subunit SecB